MSKTVTIGARPKAPHPTPDDWVMNRPDPAPAAVVETPPLAEVAPPDAEPMKRLTIDVPAELHARMKSQCALRGVKMADEVRVLLQNHFPALDRDVPPL